MPSRRIIILDCCAVQTCILDCCAVQTYILDCCAVQTCILDCCAVQTYILDCCAVQSNRLLCHATYMYIYTKIAIATLLYCLVHGFNAVRAACMVVVLRYLQVVFSCLTVPNYNFLQQQSNQSLLFAVN